MLRKGISKAEAEVIAINLVSKLRLKKLSILNWNTTRITGTREKLVKAKIQLALEKAKKNPKKPIVYAERTKVKSGSKRDKTEPTPKRVKRVWGAVA